MGNLLSYVTSSNNRTYGWKRDLHDCRDHIHNFNDNFDSVIDLSPNGPKEIYDQGHLGSCTANAIAYAYEYDEYKQIKKNSIGCESIRHRRRPHSRRWCPSRCRLRPGRSLAHSSLRRCRRRRSHHRRRRRTRCSAR